jgi:DNA modification methylase
MSINIDDPQTKTGSTMNSVRPQETINRASHRRASRLLRDLKIEVVSIKSLKPYDRNAKTHPAKQIEQIANSIRQFRFTNPLLIDENNGIIAGHGRLAAARQLGMKEVQVIYLRGLSAAAKSALRIADNKIAENAGWDLDLVAQELQFVSSLDLDFDLTVTGFDEADIDVMLQAGVVTADTDGADEIPEVDRSLPPVTCLGDVWILGKKGHRVYCGDARKQRSFAILLGGHKATMVITDAPYNVVINGNVSGLGRAQHREFAMASGEMTQSQFISFLVCVMSLLAEHSVDGSIHFLFMDWRHIYEIIIAGRRVYTELKNLAVWNKTNGGMGSFYRSKHELVFIFKSGTAPHINHVELGKHGRNRCNVWDYAGMNTMREGRHEELAMHPTVKPVALVADAILDCSRRGDIVLDCFGGSGTTLIAAEQTGRLAYLMEIDPIYVDVTVRRFQKLTGEKVTHAETGLTFDQMQGERATASAAETK